MDLGKFKEVKIGSDGQIIADNSDKILIIDADTIAYTSCLAAEEKVEVLGRGFYNDKEWEEIINNPSFNKEEGCYYTSNINNVIFNIKDKLERIKFNSGCKNYKLYFTIGKDNFRYKIYPEYKNNRKDLRVPLLLKEAKEYCIKELNGIACLDWEADDAVVAEKLALGDKAILCAVDKDVLNAVPGIHFNYYESIKFERSMHFEPEITELEAAAWPYMQCIMGDTSDNIIGIKGYGPKKANKAILDVAPEDRWAKVVEIYEKAGRTKDEALLNFRLVCMTQLVDGKIILVEEEDL